MRIEITIPATAHSRQRHFNFTPDCIMDKFIKWGDFGNNYWFTARIGKTPAKSRANAMQHIKANLRKVEGATITFDDEPVSPWTYAGQLAAGKSLTTLPHFNHFTGDKPGYTT